MPLHEVERDEEVEEGQAERDLVVGLGSLGFRVQGLGFGPYGLSLGVWGLVKSVTWPCFPTKSVVGLRARRI